MKMTDEVEVLKSEKLDAVFADLKQAIVTAARAGTAVHEVEKELWKIVLQIGRQSLGMFFRLLGPGDLGETMELPDGRICYRLPELHRRRYVAIFGEYELERAVYGSREGQAIEYVPLDNRLQLPKGVFSYLLQDWDQGFCVEDAFGVASTTVGRILGLQQSVDSLEHMNVEMAQDTEAFRLNRPEPEPASEGEIIVASADGKGIVMRRSPEDPPPAAHPSKGDKLSKKKMGVVGTVYTVDPYVRTPEQVVAALFRDKQEAKPPPRPKPQNKRVWASLEQEGKLCGQRAVFLWLLWEVALRDLQCAKILVCLHDGQESLWEARAKYLRHVHSVDILDLLHVTPRIWKAAHVFYAEGSDEAEQFVRVLLLRVLQGKAAGVIRGLREMASKRGIKGSKKTTLTKVCTYLHNNLERMHYDEYLAKGLPIATGVIEGACRHLVKDRMERAGMHWRLEGAQAMLDLRSTYVTGDWDEYQQFRIERERKELYPFRELVVGRKWSLAA
jgi:hypothetical protein